MRTGGGGCFLRGNLRRRQNRDCDDQPKTSGGAMHNLFSRQLSAYENDEDVNALTPSDKPQGTSKKYLERENSLRSLKRMGLSAVEMPLRTAHSSAKASYKFQRHQSPGGGGGNRGSIGGLKRKCWGKMDCGWPE